MMTKSADLQESTDAEIFFKLITALKQICNHPYQFLKSGEMSKGNVR